MAQFVDDNRKKKEESGDQSAVPENFYGQNSPRQKPYTFVR
jgi:hypothetical protein